MFIYLHVLYINMFENGKTMPISAKQEEISKENGWRRERLIMPTKVGDLERWSLSCNG